ncbi:MAG: hypothetical protein LAQ69_20365 [Acidobacteriia bacterium]|nr:hypothetical protein [Terriglobia bacterium]
MIIAFSLVLLVYWFRYSCILLLRNHSELVDSPRAIVDNRFRVVEVQERLRTAEPLDPLHASLQRDYQVLIYLFEHAAGLELAAFEDRLLVIDYKVMQWWYRLTKTAAPDQARRALTEMASVLAILVGKIDQRAGLYNEV